MNTNLSGKGNRILIGLVPLPEGETAIQTAVKFATAVDMEVLGVFIHEESLMNIIHLPIASVIDHRGDTVEHQQKELMLNDIKVMAKRYGRSIESEATKRNVKWQYKQSDGNFSRSLDTHKSEGDFIVVPASYYRNYPTEFINLIKNLSAKTPGVIVTPDNPPVENTNDVSVIVSGQGDDVRRLDLGLQLAFNAHGRLNILSTTRHSDPVQLLEKCTNRKLLATVKYSVEYIDEAGPISIVPYIQHQNPAYMLINADWSCFSNEATVSYLFRLIKSPMVLLQ